jgi:hypothetical protein
MKTIQLPLLTSLVVLSSLLVRAQQINDTLNGNSVSAILYDQGGLFNNSYSSSPGYELPSGSGNHLIYNTGFWFGGTNQNGDLKLAGRLFGQATDFYRGPYSTSEDYFDTSYVYEYQEGIWTVSKSEIVYHIDNYNQPNYVAPDAILNWPGNGNTSIGVASQLAPYVDVDNNNQYEPYEGDYPCIKGDIASYQIMHDDRVHASSGGEKIGAEIHMMIYQIASGDYIDSTTFIDVTIINKGQNNFSDFKSALYVDGDIGFSDDEYLGSNPSRNLMYIYNGTNNDPGGNGAPGYGTNPPSMGVVSLNMDIDYSGYFNRPDIGAPYSHDPSTPADYWNYMNGKWRDGTDWTQGGNGYGGTTPTQHMYDGNPFQGTGWTELDTDGMGTANSIGDRRFVMTTVESNFTPGDTLEYHYAVIANRRGNNLENTQGIIDYADSVQQYYNNMTNSCVEQGTGNLDVIEPPEENLLLNFEITRVDGEGNMSRSVAITTATEQNILDSTIVQNIEYQRGKGPISARLTDTVNHAVGHFVLKFNDYVNVDTANWTIYHYDTIGGVLIDSVNSTSAIDVGNEQFISQWGMAFKIEQINYFCSNYVANCPERDKVAEPIFSDLTFEDNNLKWLTGVKHANSFSPVNWLMSGFFNGTPSIPGDTIHDPACYGSQNYDPYNIFTNMANGIAAPSRLARFGDCMLTPMAISSSVSSNSYLNSIYAIELATVFHPSVDIVFTDDTSKWTRCAVIELHKDDQTALNGGKAGFLRQSPSVNKLGNPDGSGTGMSWFPGYAIDVETGRRLNMAFCENSTLTADNGDDMVWNPSDRLMDNDGNYVLGGQHTIYVFGGEEDGMPNYDGGAFIEQKLGTETAMDFRNVYSNLSWVVQPILESGQQLNATDARMKLRINKEFKTRVISNRNEGRPMFSWDVIQYEDLLSTEEMNPILSTVNVYPNPANEKIMVTWENVPADEILLYSFQGKLVKKVKINTSTGNKTLDVGTLNKGVYFVKIGSKTKKLIVN